MGFALALMLGSISWSAPSTCPSQSEMDARLENVRARVLATVTEVDGAFELEVLIDGQLRRLRAPTCHEAADTTVFLAELVSGTIAARKPLVLPPHGDGEAVPPPPPPPFHLLALAGAELVWLPSPVPRFGLSFQYDLPWLRIGVDVRTAPPMAFAGRGVWPGVQVTPAFEAQLQVCRLFGTTRLEAGPCLQGGIGVITAAGFNVAAPQQRSFAVWTFGPALRAAVSILTNLEAQFFASMRFGPLLNFVVDESQSVQRTGRVGLDLGAALGVRF